MKLGNHFPPDFRSNRAEQLLKEGAVLRFMNSQTTPPKIKFVVVVGFNAGEALLAYVFINTKMPPHNDHICLEQQDNSYLDYDSYVDCSALYKEPKEALIQRLLDDMNTISAPYLCRYKN